MSISHTAASQRIASAIMDMLVRAVILEAYAHAVPGSWTKGGSTPGVYHALEKAKHTFPDIDESWVSLRDQEVYRKMLAAAKKIVGTESAEEVVQEIISGMSLKEGELQAVGRILRQKNTDLSDPKSLNSAKFLLAHHTGSRAIDKMRSEKSRKENLPSTERFAPGTGEGDMGFDMGNVNDSGWKSVLIHALQSPAGAALYSKIHDVLRNKMTPSEMSVFDKWVDNPDASDTQIGRDLGVNNTYVSKIMRRIMVVAPEVIERNPEFLKDVHLQEELNQMGYGSRMASFSRLASNLARILSR